MQVGAEAAQLDRPVQLLPERLQRRLGGDQQGALEVLDAVDVALELDVAPEVGLERVRAGADRPSGTSGRPGAVTIANGGRADRRRR